jgi:branched-chain amino acid transport system substrate-binding protein
VAVDQRSPVSEASFSAVLNVARLMDPGALAPAVALKAKLAASHDQPGALAHPYTCDGKQLPLLQSVCNSNVRLLQYRSGAFTDILGVWITGAKLNELVS